MKILFVIPGNENDGKMPFAKKQVASLKAKGLDVKTFYLSSRTNPAIIAKYAVNLRKAIKLFQPDIIHAHYGTMTAFLCAFTNIYPLVITFHGSDLNKTAQVDGLIRDFAGRLLSNVALLRASKVICVSESLRENLWWKKHKAEVIPCGINLDLFKPITKQYACQMLNWSMDEKVILFNNFNNSKIKRQDIAELTLDIVRKSIPNARLCVLNNVKDEMVPVYINASDCLLLCSDNEGSPTIIKEAMACNLPIVSVDVGDVKERIAGTSNTVIAEQGPVKLAEAILAIVKDNSRSNGREIIINELSEDVIANRVIALYQQILRERNK